ncbi:hypothetical protein SEA_ODYSSEY395_102 [Arthrobacter phage Odyssey395]|nr:hypothetical protein SEA_ODYSSEY395_102 [Arthrobacter phage Odyssey395]
MSRTSEDLLSRAPIFFEALAAAAQCTPADAAEHFVEISSANELGRTRPVERFLEDYAVEEEPSE